MLHALLVLLALTQFPQPPAGQPQQAAPPPGTATIRGHIYAADTGQPLRKAQVRITAGEIRENRLATTDANGAYEFTEVRAGRYTVAASKGSFVTMSYGQQRPNDPPRPIEIADRQTVERLDLSLPRGAVVTGRIVDEFGEPLPDVTVTTQRYQFMQGRRTLIPAGRQSITNDIGEFRIFGIPPGQYYLSAAWRIPFNGPTPANPNASPSPADRVAFPTTYFPGATNVTDAQRVTLAAGQQLDDVMMTLRAVKAARVTGTVTGSDGKPMASAAVIVSQASGFVGNFAAVNQVRPDGTFTLNGLVPGEYRLMVQRGGPSADGPEFASATISVNGDDLADVHLMASKPSSVRGRVIVDPAAAQQLPPVMMLGMFPVMLGGGVPAPPPPPARVAEDLTFELKAPAERMRVTLGGLGPGPAGWAIRSVRLNGVDVTDGIDFKPNEDVTGLEVELTNKVASVSGLVMNDRGQPAQQYTAIVFSQDKDKWTPGTRYQGIGRADQDGRFKISGLPAGDYYVVAVDRVEQGQWTDPDYLDGIRPSARSFSLMDGETKTIDLKLSTGS